MLSSAAFACMLHLDSMLFGTLLLCNTKKIGSFSGQSAYSYMKKKNRSVCVCVCVCVGGGGGACERADLESVTYISYHL